MKTTLDAIKVSQSDLDLLLMSRFTVDYRTETLITGQYWEPPVQLRGGVPKPIVVTFYKKGNQWYELCR